MRLFDFLATTCATGVVFSHILLKILFYTAENPIFPGQIKFTQIAIFQSFITP